MKPSRWIWISGWRGIAFGTCLLVFHCHSTSASGNQPPAAKANASKKPAGADELSRLRAAHRASPDDPQKALELGLLLFQRDKASLEAQGLLDEASRRFPQRHDVHLKLLESYLERRNASAVAALLARLQPELDSNEDFAFDAAYCLLKHGARPNDPQKALELGLHLFQRDKAILEAQDLLDVASRRFPRRHDVHLMLLESYLLRENAPAVTALLARLQPEIDSDDRLAFDVTYYLLQYRQFPLAQSQWQRINERIRKKAPAPDTKAPPPEVTEALFVQGLLATAAGRKEEALQLFDRTVSQGFPPPDSPQMFMLADSFYWLEEFSLAIRAYSVVIQRFPGNLQARLRLGASLYWTSQLAPAKEELDRVARENPRQLEANLYLGFVLFAMKRMGEARTCFERELALDPNCSACMYKMGYLAYIAGDDRLAESWLAKAVALGSASPEIDLVYGMIANRAGKYDDAIRHLSRAIEKIPQFPQAHFQLATAYQRSGNAEKAQEHFALYRQITAAQNTPSSEKVR
jgi:tetratricopeptide (TPR) repeat protein